MKKYILASFVSVFLWSCKTQATAENTKPVDVAAPVSNKAFIQTVTKKSAFEQVKINSKIDVQTGNNIPTIDATIYIENGQKVWMNMSVLINIARGIATPEGIKGYERWNKTYIESDFSYLNNLLNVNFINYDALQNLLVGKTFVPVNSKDFILNKNLQGYTLNSSENQKVTVDGKTTEYKISLDYSSFFDLNKVLLQEINSSNSLEVIYSNWESFGSERFPKNVKIIIKGEKSGQVLIENTKFDFLKMQTPYSVPSGYTKVNIR